jgi:hypothetical protein
MNNDTQSSQTENQNETQGLDLDSDVPLTPACPMNPEDREGCEACQ